MTISAHADYRRNDYRFERQQSRVMQETAWAHRSGRIDWEWVGLWIGVTCLLAGAAWAAWLLVG